MLEAQDFSDDQKDAGEVGAGHTITALYEIVPGKAVKTGNLKYQTKTEPISSNDIAFIKIRYKKPGNETSKLIEYTVDTETNQPSENFKFASAAAAFAMKLRNSEHLNAYSWDKHRSTGSKIKGQ